MEAGVDVLVNLVMDSLEDLLIAVANVVDPDAASKIDVFFAFYVRDNCALCLLSKDGMNIERALWNMFISFHQQRLIIFHPDIPPANLSSRVPSGKC